jgi:integrase
MPLKPDQVERLIRESAGQPQRRHPDGNNLYLVTGNGNGSWVLNYWVKDAAHKKGGYVRCTGLGSAPDVSAKRARLAREDFLYRLRNGTAVVAPRRVKHAPAAPVVTAGTLFRTAAAKYLADHSGEWKPSEQVRYTRLIEKRCAPIADMPVTAITPQDIADMLRPFWTGPAKKPGSLVRSFCERILGAATIMIPDYSNPAAWAKQKHLLSTASREVEHHAALPWGQLPALWTELAADASEQSRALRFIILTAVRKEEALGAYWHEIDIAGRLWTIPGERMKGGKPHIVPLSEAAIDLLGKPGDGDTHMFSGNGLNRYLAGFGRLDPAQGNKPITIHGFRSTFRDWAADHGFDDHVSEKALSHTDGNKVRAAYKRSELMAARRRLADAYSAFATGR